jgi:hypothetical protein
MNKLCFLSDMTSAEWASWMQALFAGVAIIAAAIISSRQSKAQYEGARKLQLDDNLRTQLRITAAIGMLARNSSRAVQSVATSLGTIDQLHAVGEGKTHLDLGEIRSLAGAISAISLHDLPSAELVRLTMILNSTIRQFEEIVRAAIRQYREMDSGGQFTDFFNTVQQMILSLNTTITDFEEEQKKLSVAD